LATLAYRQPAILKQIPHDRHVVIEANAGTGKTHTIEHLVLDLLLKTSCSIEEILVVTFTEKATAELRARIRQLLEGVLAGTLNRGSPRDDELVAIDNDGKRKIEIALFSFDRAPIYTIHAFCQRILADLAFDTASGFSLELIDSRRAFHRAFRSELREVLANSPATRPLLDEWMRRGETARQKNLVDSLEDLLYQAHFHRYLDTAASAQNELAAAELAGVFDGELLAEACKLKSKRLLPKANASIKQLETLIKQNRQSPQELRKALGQLDSQPLPDLAIIASRGGSARMLRLVDTLDAAALIGAAIGMPAANGGNWASNDAFAGGALGDFSGQVALSAQRVSIKPKLAAREFRAALRLSKDAIAFDGVTGEIAGGRLTGQLAFKSTDAGLSARGKIALTGADAASLLPAATRPPVTGSLDIDADIEGAGWSPAAVLGSLHGASHVTLSNGQLAGLDPHAFTAVSRAVDNGLAPGVSQLSEMVGRALESGRFPVKHAQGDIAISAGQARLSGLNIHGEAADLSLAGNLDFTDGSVDARIVLSGPAQGGGTRPDIYVALTGPVTAPTRAVDVSALTGWLTLRAIENQAKKLKMIEGAATPAPKTQQAPALPAPVDIRLSPPRAARPEASVDPHH